MILAIGTDIVEIIRIKNAIEKWGSKFLKKIFTEKETHYCYKKKDPYPHFAVRFAAKEALVKALSSEKTEYKPIVISNFKNIEILNHPSGKPYVNLLGNIKTNTQNVNIHLTLAHEHNYAIATVVLERKNS